MSLYERMRMLAAQFDLLNAEHHRLNQQLREVVIEAQIEKDGYTQKFRRFVRDMKRKNPYKN